MSIMEVIMQLFGTKSKERMASKPAHDDMRKRMEIAAQEQREAAERLREKLADLGPFDELTRMLDKRKAH